MASFAINERSPIQLQEGKRCIGFIPNLDVEADPAPNLLCAFDQKSEAPRVLSTYVFVNAEFNHPGEGPLTER